MSKNNNIRLFIAAALAASLTVGANAAFEKPNTYSEGQFDDVKSNAWYAKEVASAYELGFMNGTDDNVFSPDGNVTVGQGITMAARVNASYNGKEISTDGSTNWYDGYVKYAVDNGIMTEDMFDSYTRNITRGEMAQLFAAALPDSEFKAINNVEHVPDVVESTDYAAAVLKLYNAGVVMGSDDYGMFNPDSDIKRSESAAIINRVALPDNRITGELKDYDVKRDSYVLAYFDGTMSNSIAGGKDSGYIRENIEAGWKLDNRGGAPRNAINESISGIVDVSDTQPTSLYREFNKIDKDVIFAEFNVMQAVEKGGAVKFCDIDGKDAFVYGIVDGSWAVLGKDGSYTAIAKAEVNSAFRTTLDVPAGKVKTYINNVYCGEHDMLSDNVASIRFTIDEAGKGTIVPGKMNIVANYGAYEIFDNFKLEEEYGWTTDGDASIVSGELVLSGKATAEKKLNREIDTKYIAEMLAIFPDGETGGYRVMSGDNAAVEIVSRDGKLYANGEVVYEKLTKNMWYRLRVEANPSTGKAKMVINGRELAEFQLKATAPVDSIEMFSENGKITMDEIKVYEKVEHYDYVPAPYAKANLDDYIVAINVCSLWYNDGSHFGWACITPYDENRPVLGYYDEGSPESADWEIKYMVEGGIDVQALCWYPESGHEGPIKKTGLSSQLNNGLQHAKYQNYMKYCLIYEAAGKTVTPEQFENYVVPYLFENYFLDENYLVIDNKPVLHIYALSTLNSEKMFGSPENTKKALDKLEETARSYGFDGMLYISNGAASEIQNAGIDGYAAYHWSAQGYKYDVNVARNTEMADSSNNKFYAIPTISVGYSDFAWRNQKMPLMTKEDWSKSHDWVKETYIPKYAEKGTWQEKLVWLSTWNEYGEGTYIMPSGLCGFDYLDVTREKYTDFPKDLPHVVPTEAQAERINHLYPQYARLLRYQGDYEDPTLNDVTKRYEVVKTIDLTADNVSLNEYISNAQFEDGIMSAYSTGVDFNFTVKGSNGLDLSEIGAVRFKLQVPVGKSWQIYFSTASEPTFSESKSVSGLVADGGLNEITVDLAAKNAYWTGILGNFRIDPCNGENIEFKVGQIEFLKVVTESNIDPKYVTDGELYINNSLIDSVIYPEKCGDKVLYPFDPETAIDHRMFSLLEWEHDTRTLTLTANNHTVSFNDGSDKYTVDGQEKALGYTLYSVDGIPMIDFKLLAEALGFTYKEDGNKLYIETPEIDMIKRYEIPGVWEFNDFTSEGWYAGSKGVTVVVSGDGYLKIDNSESTNTDPQMYTNKKVNFSAKKYSSLEMKVRYKYNKEGDGSDGMCIYYLTSLDNTWNEAKTIRMSLNSKDSEGEWEVYTCDLTSKANWLGNVTNLRFDPFNAIGEMEIDYIRFIEDPNYDPEKADKIDGIINGDAEIAGVMTFTSGNAKVEIVEDETNPGNHVYQFTGPKSKAWTYAVHRYPFEYGKKYKISFDARGVSDSDGNKVRMDLSVNIQYASESGINHDNGGRIWLEADGSWTHFETVYLVSEKPFPGADPKFSCYSTPSGETVSHIYQLDNVVIEEVEE